jgi:hypothetical protein
MAHDVTAKHQANRVQPKADSIDAFLAKVKSIPPQTGTAGRGRLIFAMDATMSRKPTWDRALSIQGEMFVEAGKTGSLDVQLVYFRGFDECRASRWVNDAKTLARLMSTVDCQGGNTQIHRVLTHLKIEAKAGTVNALVYVGDAMEENIDQLCALAGEIGLLGIPLFMFQEGSDPLTEQAYREMARLSRGAYFKLDSASAGQLAELLRAVAAFASGGAKALQSTKAGRLLLEQLK